MKKLVVHRPMTDGPTVAVDLSVAAEPVGPSGMVRSVFTALAFDAFLYCCGRFVVAPYVLRGCSSVPRRLFAASFSLSLALLTLVLVEVLVLVVLLVVDVAIFFAPTNSNVLKVCT